jgi:mannose-6-phosphate isomerase class I
VERSARTGPSLLSYDPNPWYPVAGGEPVSGYAQPAAELAARSACILAVDGPGTLPWERLVADLRTALRGAGMSSTEIDVRARFAPWDEIRRRTAAAELPGDPVFARVFEGTLADFFDELPRAVRREDTDTLVVFGPGSALVDHDVLWYADVPKQHALTAVQRGEAANIGQPPGEAGSESRLFFVDWPVLARHKQALVGRVDRYFDLSDAAAPCSLDGESLRRSLRELASRPFRTRPTYLPGPWGGQWLRRALGITTDAPNLAWSYELITPESGIVFDSAKPVEVGFELLMAEQSERVLGAAVSKRFGLSFPIRFDYLDTLEGGDLSIQCHPSEKYMRETFGLPYTQHESYYVMVTRPGAKIFLGLREHADLDAFRAEAERAEEPDGKAFVPERHLQTHPAEQHRLYLIPAGTPHASGAGNVVLEISATPYLYTLRFYDWLRRDLGGELRPVHLAHAFSNLDLRRSGEAVRRELIPEPRPVRAGPGWVELELGRGPELFFGVNRLDFEESVSDDTAERFHVLNLVEGEQVAIETASGVIHPLAYAETIVVPASVGQYRIRRLQGGACKVVKAFVL